MRIFLRPVVNFYKIIEFVCWQQFNKKQLLIISLKWNQYFLPLDLVPYKFSSSSLQWWLDSLRGCSWMEVERKKDNKFRSLKSTIKIFDDCVIPICFIGSLMRTLYTFHPIFHFFPFRFCVVFCVCVFVLNSCKQMEICVKQAFIKRVTFMTITCS